MTQNRNLRTSWRWSVAVASLLLLLTGAGTGLAQDICDPGAFCDRDGDGFIRDHRKCSLCGGSTDCDDTVFGNDCGGGTSAVFTAELTAGAFVFLYGPVTDLRTDAQENELWSDGTDVVMRRPTDDGTPDGPAATWDDVFWRGCPTLFARGRFAVEEITSSRDKWSITEYGDNRLVLRDILLTDAWDIRWDVTLQLIGPEGGNEVPFLPAPGETSLFALERFRMYGREVRGGPGGRQSCAGGPHALRSPSSLEISQPLP